MYRQSNHLLNCESNSWVRSDFEVLEEEEAERFVEPLYLALVGELTKWANEAAPYA